MLSCCFGSADVDRFSVSAYGGCDLAVVPWNTRKNNKSKMSNFLLTFFLKQE